MAKLNWPPVFIGKIKTIGIVRGIAADSSGNVYVNSNGRIQKLTTTGAYISTIAVNRSK
ncbi:MAG: hypothetical protein M3457_21920 [Chloroflexota bacterium]|nr:hypothetical protein [Chloroflexota bacterium]